VLKEIVILSEGVRSLTYTGVISNNRPQISGQTDRHQPYATPPRRNGGSPKAASALTARHCYFFFGAVWWTGAAGFFTGAFFGSTISASLMVIMIGEGV
jgi:hypothetical protein